MKKILKFLITNQVTFSIGMLIVYAFYGAVFGISLIPSAILIYKVFSLLDFTELWHFMLLAITIGISLYLFFIVALLVFGVVERILVMGFKPGRYSTSSFTFVRWLIYSGLHI